MKAPKIADEANAVAFAFGMMLAESRWGAHVSCCNRVIKGHTLVSVWLLNFGGDAIAEVHTSTKGNVKINGAAYGSSRFRAFLEIGRIAGANDEDGGRLTDIVGVVDSGIKRRLREADNTMLYLALWYNSVVRPDNLRVQEMIVDVLAARKVVLPPPLGTF